MNRFPEIRLRSANQRPVRADGQFVLYWMIAFRRGGWNFSLERAVQWAQELQKPLVVFEPLRSEYPWASRRLHAFILQGMADNAQHFKKKSVFYYPYVEPHPDAGKGLLEALAKDACVVVTDDFPVFFIPRMIASAARKIPVLMETVDSNGLLPLRSAERVFQTAYAFRRFIQKTLPTHLLEIPLPDPLKGKRLPRFSGLGKRIEKKWPPAGAKLLAGVTDELASFPIDSGVTPVTQKGGSRPAVHLLDDFLANRLHRYKEMHNQPEAAVSSGLSPYLHFGHISAHHIFRKVMDKENWSFKRLSQKATGSREGWWGMSPDAEAFLDQLVTWRELGFNICWQQADYDQYDSLPDWAAATLKAHAHDKREHLYEMETFEKAATHDPLWNAAQVQLLREGRIHNYLRMLWGKKILEWSASPREALQIMLELNNRYALDGRDPNSYSGIFWILGRFDRPWGPERAVFGKVRYMSSRNTAKKVRVGNYIKQYVS